MQKQIYSHLNARDTCEINNLAIHLNGTTT